MKNPKYINIIKTDNVRQVNIGGLVIGTYDELADTKSYASAYPHGQYISIWDGEVEIELIDRSLVA